MNADSSGRGAGFYTFLILFMLTTSTMALACDCGQSPCRCCQFCEHKKCICLQPADRTPSPCREEDFSTDFGALSGPEKILRITAVSPPHESANLKNPKKKKTFLKKVTGAIGWFADLLPFSGGSTSGASLPAPVPPPIPLLQEIPLDQTEDAVADSDSIYALVEQRLGHYRCSEPPASLNIRVHQALNHQHYAAYGPATLIAGQAIAPHLEQYQIYLAPEKKFCGQGFPNGFLSYLKKLIQEATCDIYYQITLGFSSEWSISIFLHTVPGSNEAMLYFHQTIYVMPISELYRFLLFLMENKACSSVLHDQLLYEQ